MNKTKVFLILERLAVIEINLLCKAFRVHFISILFVECNNNIGKLIHI